MWYDDDIGTMNFTIPPIHYLLFYAIKPERNIKTKTGFRV